MDRRRGESTLSKENVMDYTAPGGDTGRIRLHPARLRWIACFCSAYPPRRDDSHLFTGVLDACAGSPPIVAPCRMPRPLLLRTPAMIGSILIVVFCTLAGAAIGTGIGQTTAVAQQRTEAGVLAQLWLRRVKEIGAEADRALAAINQYPAPFAPMPTLRISVRLFWSHGS
ncbi:hypothetical protein WM40_17870 [Robbsia andropogonis]|uniref:Uncharacterized protein n=1 Tax=Robbsia andropogonis TaxID=28092 RepID=A0A0F5JWU2_9BURK|nr:hypothetical protein [Robbsia andropogonis]KKB62331.1 hypothetical protein WM40_17870 [Robbsia andropogonis]